MIYYRRGRNVGELVFLWLHQGFVLGHNLLWVLLVRILRGRWVDYLLVVNGGGALLLLKGEREEEEKSEEKEMERP